MIRTSVSIAVDDVRRSSEWYQRLLDCRSPMSPDSDHRELFDLLEDSDGDSVIVLSRWDHRPVPSLRNKKVGPPGHGTMLCFAVPDFDNSWSRAKALGATVVAKPHPSRGFEIPEYTIVDPDGYLVTVSAGSRS